MGNKRSLIINTPWYYPKAHQTIISLFTHPNYQSLIDKVIFMGSAAPLGALQPSTLLKSYLQSKHILINHSPLSVPAHKLDSTKLSHGQGQSHGTTQGQSQAQGQSLGLGEGESMGLGEGIDMSHQGREEELGALLGGFWDGAWDGDEGFKVLDECAAWYRQWAQREGITLLVCGMAAKRFYQDNKLKSCEGLELTGYMEVLSLINGPSKEVLIW